MKNIFYKITFFISLFLTTYTYACHNSTINSVGVVDNANGTKTYTISVSIDVGTLDGYSYGFALLFSNSCGTTPVVTSLSTANLTRSGYSNLVGRFGSTIGSTFPGGAPNDFFLMRYANRNDVLTYEAIDNLFGFGSTDYNNQIITVTVSGIVDEIVLDADFRSVGTSTATAQCLKTYNVPNVVCPCGSCATPTCPIAGPYTDLTTASSNSNHCSQIQTLIPSALGPNVYESYYSVTLPSTATTLGLVISDGSGVVSPYVGPCTLTRNAVLYTSPNTCSTAGTNPTSVGSTFYNPVWTGLTPGATYIIKVSVSVNAGCEINDQCASYYTLSPVAGCTTCATASCPVTSITTTTAPLGQTGISTALTAAGNQLGINSIVANQTKTVCVPVAVPSGSTILGFKTKLNALISSCVTPPNITISYELKNSACGPIIPPTRSNASSVASGFNPEWDNLPSGNYVLCFTITASASLDPFICAGGIDLYALGYYNVIPIVTCSTCATANCTVSSVTGTTAAVAQADNITNITTIGDNLNLSPMVANQTNTVCVPVVVPSGSSILGFNNNLVTQAGCAIPANLSITYQLKNSSCGTTISPNRTNAFSVGSGFNPEWDNLTPGNYVLCYTITTNSNIGTFSCPSVDLAGIGYYNVIAPTTCQDYQIKVFNDEQLSTEHFGTYSCTDTPVYLGPQTVPTVFDSGLPFNATTITITSTTGNLNNLVLNRYDATTNTLVEQLAVDPTDPNVINYFLRPNGQYYKLDKINIASGTYPYVIKDLISGLIIASGTWTITGGVESAASITFTPAGTSSYSGPGVTNGFDPTGIDNYTNDRGIGMFNPAVAGPGTHTITYTWDNGLAGSNHCTLTRTKVVTVTATPAPIVPNAVVCNGGSASITAMGLSGSVFKWYDAATNGNLLFTGSTFTTPTVSTTTSYWVSQTATCGESARTQVTVSIGVQLLPTYAKTISDCPLGSVSFGVVSPTGTTFNWISGPSGYTFPTGFQTPLTTNTSLTNLPSGTYCVDITTPQTTSAVTTTLFYENFESGTSNWSIDNSNGKNIFLVNNVYVGGTCVTGAGSYTVPTVPNQPITVASGPTSNYLHIMATTTTGAICTAASTNFIPLNANFDGSVSDQKVTLLQEFNTVGKSNVTFKFVWLARGDTLGNDYGAIEYSINNGAWTQIGSKLFGFNTWQTTSLTSALWSNVANLRFRIRWVNNATTSTDHPLSIDEISITASENVITSCPNTNPECIVIKTRTAPTLSCGTSTTTSVSFTWPAVASATSYNVSYTKNGGAPTAVSNIGNTLSFSLSSLVPNDNICLVVTPVGGVGTCFTSASLCCVAQPCPTITCTVPSNIITCAGNTIPLTAFTSTPAGATYTWTNSNTAIGLAASGTGNIAAFTATNPTAATITATITVTPSVGSCTGTASSYTITISPRHIITLSSAATTNQAICVNTALTNITYTLSGGATSATVSGLPTGITSSVSGTTLTISGTPTVSGTFTYNVTTTGNTCAVATASETITVNPVHSLLLTSSNATQAVCTNTAISNISYIIGGGATSATVTGLPTGISANVSGTTLTISGSSALVGTYTYTVTTTGNACSVATATGTITINPNHTITLSSAVATTNQAICVNTALTNITYTLSGGATGATVSGLPTGITSSVSGTTLTISGTPTVSGTFTYNVTTTGNTCAVATASGTITVNPAHTLTLTSANATQAVCANTAIANITYTIGGGATSATVTGLPTGISANVSGTTLTISGSSALVGTYTYTVTTTGNACAVATATGTITINPNHTLTLSSAVATTNQAICVNTALTNITYTLSGGATGATVSGLPTGITSSVSGTTLTISGTPTVSGTFTYNVTTTGNTCAVATATGTITVNPAHTLTLTSANATQAVCTNTAISNISYTIGGGATSATVTGLPTGISANVSGTTLTISGASALVGTYTYNVTTTGNACAVATATGTITINPNHTITLSSAVATTNQAICVNTALTNITYTLSGGATGATVSGLPTGITSSVSGTTLTISGTPTVSGTFTYNVTTTGNTCAVATASGTITVNPAHSLTLTSANATQAVCMNTAITNITYTISGGATSATVTGLPAGISANVSGTTLTISGASALVGTYTYTVTTTGNTCTIATATGTITINPNHTLTLSSAAATTNQAICINAPLTNITYTLGGGATSATVSGLPAGITSTVTGTTLTISGTPTVSGTFTYNVTTTGNTCAVATATGTITVNPAHSLTLTSANATQAVCMNTAITNITYTISGGATSATVTGLPTGISANVSGTTLTISGASALVGTYTYNVTTTGNACAVATATGTITINPNHTLTATTATSQTLCVNTVLTNITYTLGGGATSATVSGLPAGITSTVTGTTLTISGTPTVSGTFTYNVTTTGNTCAVATATGTITVNPAHSLTLTSANATQAVCMNTAIANITYTMGGGATSATVTGLPTGISANVSGTTLTISGSSALVGTYTYTVTTTGNACAIATATGTITINPNHTLTTTTTATSQTLCVNTALTNITYTLSGGATGATVSGLPTGITSNVSGTTLTISGTPSVSGTFTFNVTTTGNTCAVATATGTIIVNPAHSLTLTSANATQAVCMNTAIANITYTMGGGATSATVTGLPTGISANVSGTTLTISGSSALVGTYTYTVTTTGNACAIATATGTITINPNHTLTTTTATSQTLCVNTALTNITYTLGGGATSATVSGLPAGITSTVTGTTLTISGTTTVSGTFTYNVTTTGNTCAVATASGTITVNPAHSLALTSANATQAVCMNTAIANISYTISGGATSATVTGLPTGISANVSGTTLTISGDSALVGTYAYTVTTTGNACAIATATGTITINPNHTITATSATSQTLCVNTVLTNITYTLGGGATSATVSGLPAGITSNVSGTTLTISGTPTVSGTFTYVVTTTGNTCAVATASGTITVNPAHTLTLTSANATQAVCMNTAIANITYTISGGATSATVTGLPTGISANVSGTTLTISGSSALVGTYTYTVTTTGNACKVATATGTIQIIGTNTITLTSSVSSTAQTVCINTPIIPITYTTVGATGATFNNLPTGVTATWSINVITISGTPSVNVASPYVYTITLNGGCGVVSRTGSISVTGLPIASATDTTICSGSTASVAITSNLPNTTYTWSVVQTFVTGATSEAVGVTSFTPQTLNLIAGNVSGEATYNITPHFNGCTGNTFVVKINVKAIPTATIGVNSPICEGESSKVFLDGTPNSIITYSENGAVKTVVLDSSGKSTITTANLTTNTIFNLISASTSGTPSCSQALSASATIVVNPKPGLYSDTIGSPICSGETIPISILPNLANTTFTWTVSQIGCTGATSGTGTSIGLNAYNFTQGPIFTTKANSAGSVVYTITPSMSTGCVGTPFTITVLINPTPNPTLKDGVICVVSSTGAVYNPLTLVSGLSTTNYSFNWYYDIGAGAVLIPSANDSSYVVDKIFAGTPSVKYSVIATDKSTGCKSATVTATVTEAYPLNTISAEVTEMFSDNPTITVFGGNANTLYQLDYGPIQSSNIFTPVTLGNHTIKVTDVNGCTDLTLIKKVIGYPPYFTPNGDSYNDYWNVIGLEDQPKAQILIFDRYGKLIKQLFPNERGWDGTYNGYELPSSDYWFTIEYVEDNQQKIFRSHFSLKR